MKASDVIMTAENMSRSVTLLIVTLGCITLPTVPIFAGDNGPVFSTQTSTATPSQTNTNLGDSEFQALNNIEGLQALTTSELARIEGGYLPIDVCKTPTPGGPVPIPYPNIARVKR